MVNTVPRSSLHSGLSAASFFPQRNIRQATAVAKSVVQTATTGDVSDAYIS